LGQVEFAGQRSEDFDGEESNLAFVVLLEVEKAITSDAPAGNAFDLAHFDSGIIAGELAVAAKVVVAGRDEQLVNFDHAN